MKAKTFLAVIVFLAAIGSAIGSELFTAENGWTRKMDVPAQEADCVFREQCDGESNACTIIIDHDDDPETDDVEVDLYDGICVNPLLRD